MLNLLPLEEKKKVLTEYRLRLAAVFIFTAAFLIVANLILLIPSYLNAITKHNFVEDRYNYVMGSQDFQKAREVAGKEAAKKITEINNKLKMFAPVQEGNQTKFVSSSMLQKIFSLKPSTVKIGGATHEVLKDREKFVITGRSVDRESLKLFVDKLNAEKLFTSVELPIQSYVKSTNIEFSLTLERAQKVEKPKTTTTAPTTS